MNDWSAAELATRDVAERIHNLESAVRKDQAQTAAEHGLPRDLVATQESVWRRISPLRNRWPEVLEFDMRVVELEQRQAEIQRELADLHARANAAPDVDAMVLADWELGDRKGPRPEPTLPGIQDDIRERQGSWEALTAAINKVLAEKVAFFERNRGRLVKQADRQAEDARARYLRLIDELAEAREDLRGYRRAAVLARLYPTEQAAAEPPDSFAGARKRALAPLGIGAPVAPDRVLDALRADAQWLAEAATPEQRAAMAGIDPRTPPNTEWSDDPEVKARRAQRMAAWANSR
jgi:hypothetical protein